MSSKKAKVVSIKKPKKETTARRPAGHLMAEVATALWQSYDYGETVTEKDLLKLLADNGRKMARDRTDVAQWVFAQRSQLNEFGSNVELLREAGLTEFQLTTQPGGKAYRFCTNGQDLLLRDRPRECVLKEMKSIKVHSKRITFVNDNPAMVRYCEKVIRRSGELVKFLNGLELERAQLSRSENIKADLFNNQKKVRSLL